MVCLFSYTKEQMFDVVADVEAYPKFVPWCTDAKIVYRRSGLALAELEVGFTFLVMRYTSSILLQRPNLVKVPIPTYVSLFSSKRTKCRY